MLSDNAVNVALELRRQYASGKSGLNSSASLAEFARQVQVTGWKLRDAIDELEARGLIRVAAGISMGVRSADVPADLCDIAGIEICDALPSYLDRQDA